MSSTQINFTIRRYQVCLYRRSRPVPSLSSSRWVARLRTTFARRPLLSSSRRTILTRRPPPITATSSDTDERAKTGIAGAQSAADTADQHALAAGQSADAANKSAQEAYNRVDSLSGVVANLDNYKQLSDVSVTFGFDKYVLTAADKKQLDDIAANLDQRARLHSGS